ncbi:hypothetical protein G6L26_009720 [Agrobacterium radiobacter]|uniref:hypothetical protein n=1 Tax=Agrobacterium tumefaciens complex TaxID=1183400 RepID=UPI00080FC4EA|nr:hypothetical protein [Agrobacterium tumefaciens]NTA05463.1 hypothetical protein [Agrobacterium tumefaciens]NTA92056.1 hypothetical protein [Agrobacterium tumefaciens]OCJ32211.1 hypothetical protein A6U90_09865 [Agrobacterium tumefaciens]
MAQPFWKRALLVTIDIGALVAVILLLSALIAAVLTISLPVHEDYLSVLRRVTLLNAAFVAAKLFFGWVQK